MPPVTAATIERLLEKKFDDHICFTELKGPTGNGRIDFGAIKPSWSHPDVHAMEVKVSRRDFVQDDKWPPYLDACQMFWFVTAAGIVEKSEIPEQAGWMEASKNGLKLFIRKKAPRRKMSVEHQAKLFRQLLHARHYRTRGTHDPKQAQQQAIQRFLEASDEKAQIGRAVNEKIHRVVQATRSENERLTELMLGYDKMAAAMEKLGIRLETIQALGTPRSWQDAEKLLENAMRQELETVPVEARQIVSALRQISTATERLAEQSARSVDRIEERVKELREASEADDFELVP